MNKKGMLTLLVLGSPIWLSLLISAFAAALSLYVSLWAVIISLWAGFAALAGGAVGVLLGGISLLFFNPIFPGLAMIGAALACAGLAIFFFMGCKLATKGLVWLTKRMVFGIKNAFVRKGGTA